MYVILEAGRGQNVSWEPPEGASPAHTGMSAPVLDVGPTAWKRVNVCCFNPWADSHL